MNKTGTVFGINIKQMFSSVSDRKIVDSINIRNIRNVYTFSVIACVLDAITLIPFSVMNWGQPAFFHTFFHVSYCVIACAAVAILAKRAIRKYEQENTISNLQSNVLIAFFYILLSVWGILVDAAHYGAGEQMLTFYIVQFCFVCFVAMRPRIGSVLIALSFAALYFIVYRIDGASDVQPQNYSILAIIAVFGNAIQHMMLQESEKRKLELLELNQILQQEASIDDLTELKNRKALRGDFSKHIGKTVYTIMADVDHFKYYNDTYGHVMGDNVLRLVASATKEAFRNGEAYRYGGDEFLIILADYTEEAFSESIAEWKAAIKSIRIPEIARPIACSYGYEHRSINSAEDLRSAIEAADDGLYKAKKAR